MAVMYIVCYFVELHVLNSAANLQDCNNELLFGIMEKSLQLLEMGFTENDISEAFDRCGEMLMQIGKTFIHSILLERVVVKAW